MNDHRAERVIVLILTPGPAKYTTTSIIFQNKPAHGPGHCNIIGHDIVDMVAKSKTPDFSLALLELAGLRNHVRHLVSKADGTPNGASSMENYVTSKETY